MSLRHRGYLKEGLFTRHREHEAGSSKQYYVANENGDVFIMGDSAYKKFLKAMAQDALSMTGWYRNPGVRSAGMSLAKAQRYHDVADTRKWKSADYVKELDRIMNRGYW